MASKSGTSFASRMFGVLTAVSQALLGDQTESQTEETLAVWAKLREADAEGTLYENLKSAVYSYHNSHVSKHSALPAPAWGKRYEPLQSADLTYNKIRNATIPTNVCVAKLVMPDTTYTDASQRLEHFEQKWQTLHDAKESFSWPESKEAGLESITRGVAEMDNPEYVNARVQDLATTVYIVLKSCQ